jgi:myo-inositol 2-dehydrogenase / D-chiro-inositol 1-dehydrogenase
VTADLLRVGILGVGRMGADHAERVVKRVNGARLVAVSDPATDRAKELAASFDGVRAVDDGLALIADEEVDAVLIASPGFAHEEQVLAAIEAGKPVLCEKPLTMDSASSLRLVETEAKAGRPLVQVGFMRRFDPEYAQLKRLLDSGSLGRTVMVHNVHRNKDTPPGFVSEMIVRDSLVHEVDVTRWLFGEEITQIHVLTPTPTSAAAEGVRDPQLAIFTMAGGGLATTEVFVNTGVGYEVRCEAVAERGNATIGLGSGPLLRQANHAGTHIPEDFRDRFATAYDLEVQAWVDACRRGEVVGPTAWDGYAAAVVCTAGVESLATGRPVTVELAPRPTSAA